LIFITQRGAKPIISAEHRFSKKKVEKTSKTDAGHPALGFPSLNWGSQWPTFVSSIIETGIKYLLKIILKIFHNIFLVSCLSLF
jgi:hypothetical protein